MKNILIIKTGSIGDVLRTTCVIEGLIEKYLSPRIYWLTSSNSVATIENNPFLTKIFLIENLDSKIYDINFDLVISLEEDKKCLDVLSRLKKKTVFGVYEKDDKINYTNRAAHWYNMSLISKFGKATADELKKSNLFSYPEILYRMLDLKWNKQKPRIFLRDNIKEISRGKIESKNILDKIVVGIVVGAGGRWPLKTMPADLQIKLINKIRNKCGKNVEILIISGPSDLELQNSGEIKKKLPFVKLHETVDLNTLFGIISLCDVVVCPDTLSMHVAISMNKYTIVYFTVTSAPEIEIYNGKKVITKDLAAYCSYSTQNPPRPNATDKIDLDLISDYVKFAVSERK